MSKTIPGPLRGAGGFTLVEALIALVISGLLASALMSLLIGQSRFYERTDDAIYAQQTLRGAFDFMSSELRMAAPLDLVAAESDSVTLRFDLAKALVCDSTAADEAALFRYDSAFNAGLAGGLAGVGYAGTYDSLFAYADGWSGTVVATGAGPKATCVANGAPATLPDDWYATMSGWTGNFPGGVPNRGTDVRFYGLLTYRFASSVFFGTRTALWRGPQELVAPFENTAAFSYVMDDASVQNSVNASDFDRVTAIRVTATATGDGANRFGVNRSLEFDVPLRN
jgi:prepilin-type N-terminal cleavage/methylation domain-containing protein